MTHECGEKEKPEVFVIQRFLYDTRSGLGLILKELRGESYVKPEFGQNCVLKGHGVGTSPLLQ